jgi:hypothetical protein
MRELKPHHYDIVRKGESDRLMWLEDAENLAGASSRIRELVSHWPGEFQIMDQQNHEVVAKIAFSVNRKEKQK